MRKCVFCKFRYKKGSKISFHKFPTDLAVRQIWLQNMKACNWKPKEKDVLCSEHFDVTCFIEHHSRRSLKNGSVPTIFEGNFEVAESCKEVEKIMIKIKMDVEEPQPSTSIYPSKYAIFTHAITASLAKNSSSSLPSCESPKYRHDDKRSVPIIKDNFQKVSNPVLNHGYSRTNKHFDHTYHKVEESTSTGANKSANDYDTKLSPSLSQHNQQVSQDTDCQLGVDGIIEEEFVEVKEEGPFSWLKPSAVVPCEEEMLYEIDAGSAVDLKQELSDPPEQPIEKGDYKCDVCSASIVGSRYTCVQCADYDICGSCEARGAHFLHYVLRVPGQRPHAEVQAALLQIRRVLLADAIIQFTKNEDVEVKEDVEDPIQVPSSVEHPTEDYVMEEDQIAESSCDEESICSAENLVALESSFEAEDEEMPKPILAAWNIVGTPLMEQSRTEQKANKQTDTITRSLSQHTIKQTLVQPNIFESLQRSVLVRVKKITAAEIKSALHKS